MIVHNHPDAIDSPKARCPTDPQVGDVTAGQRAFHVVEANSSGPVAYEVRDLNITTDGELAFVQSLNHVKGTLASGHITDLWVRWTACFRRIDGVWLVVHDHVSVPADLEHGQAVLNLTP